MTLFFFGNSKRRLQRFAPAAIVRSVVRSFAASASLLAILLCWRQASAAGDVGSSLRVIPILFNDRHVNVKPDLLVHGRVLAAIIENGRIYLPLRSMFEHFGATVSTSPDGKTITAVKSGASVSVTVGVHEVVIDGTARPLDVAPIRYRGITLVPVRVISESLGAFVQWVPDERVVVIRFISPPAPAPIAAPTVMPTPEPIPAHAIPTAEPTAPPMPKVYRGYVEGAVAAPRNYNEFSDGQYCPESYIISGAYAFKDPALIAKVDFREYAYVTSDVATDALNNHYTFFSTIDGGVAFAPVFLARQNSLDARVEYQVAAPRIALGVGYLNASNNYGYAHLSGFGLGVEKLLDLKPGFDPFGSAFYYPTASGNYTVAEAGSTNLGNTYRQQYRILKFDIGLALVLKESPVYLYGGYSGDRYGAKENAPIGQTHDGPYAGLGFKL